VVTVTSTVPTEPAGETAVTEVAELTTTPVAAAVPNFTEVAPVRFVPVMVTDVPPAGGPEEGLTAVTVGEPGATYVNWSAAPVALVPPGVVTVTSTTPAAPAGEIAVTDVLLFTTTPVAAVPPKFTPVAPVRLFPVMVTEVPPAIGPELGLTEVTVGAGAFAMSSASTDVDVPAGAWVALGVTALETVVSYATRSVVVGKEA